MTVVSKRKQLDDITEVHSVVWTYQEQEAVFEVLVRLDTAILRPLVVQSASWVEEGNIAITSCTQINLLQLQLVSRVQILIRIPQHPAVQSLAYRAQWKLYMINITITAVTRHAYI